MNINILGINELKWTGMGKSNSDDHYIHYCGQESLRRNGVALIVCIIIYVYICVCMSAYVCIYVYIYKYLCIHVYECVYFCVCECIYMCVRVCVCVCARSLQSCLLCDTIDCSPPGSSVHEIQKYWSGLPFPPPGDLPNSGTELTSLNFSCLGRQVLYH